jgi:hypothetical protein
MGVKRAVAPTVPVGLAVEYVRGTRRFLIKQTRRKDDTNRYLSPSTLLPPPSATEPTQDMIVVDCTVSNRSTMSIQRKAKTAFSMVPRSRRRFLAPTACPDDLPVQFSAFVSRPSGTVLCFEALCSVLHGCLSVDGAVFHSSIRDAARDDVESPAWTLYRGPLLHQKHLAECVCSIRGQPNPLVQYRQHQKFFFDPFVNPVTSKFARFDHYPVHTTPTAVSDQLVEFLQERGIDDDLAAYVEEYAEFVASEERHHWRELLAQSGVIRDALDS